MIKLLNQRGQVLVFGLIIMLLMSTAWLHYFATNQVLSAKAKLVHASDAAAYSGALVQAQSLNLMAYLNRAQIAHQIAMVHLVSLASWANYGATQAQQLARANPPAHLIGMLFGAKHGQAYLSAAKATGLQHQAKSAGEIGRAFAAHESFIHNDIQRLNKTLISDLPILRLQVIKNVLYANYPDYSADNIIASVTNDDWPNPIKQYRADADMFNLLRQTADLYDFLSPRNFTRKNPWSVDSRCPTLRHQLRRRGKTELNASGNWQASDMQSFHALRSNRWIGCYYREYAMGWAWLPAAKGQGLAGIYVANPPENFSSQNFWSWVKSVKQWSYLDESDNPLANSYAVRDAVHWPARGLAAYPDIVAKDRFTARSGFALATSIQADDLIHANSAAQTVFARPSPRLDRQIELANLYHPYWHASLAPQTTIGQ